MVNLLLFELHSNPLQLFQKSKCKGYMMMKMMCISASAVIYLISSTDYIILASMHIYA